MRGFTLIILALVSVVLFVDTINGIADFYNISALSNVSKFYKICLLVLVLIYLFLNEKKDFFYSIGITSLGIIGLLILNLTENINVNITEEFGFMLKIISPIIFFLFFKNIINDYFDKIKDIFFISIGILSLNLLLGIFGIGRAQYGGDIGSIGFFIAGNEVSGLMLILSSFILSYIFLNKQKKYLLYAVILLALGVIKATKTAIIGLIIISVLIPFVYSTSKNINIQNINPIRVKLLGTVCIVIFLFFLWITSQSNLALRWEQNFSSKGFVSAILSSRDIYLEKSFIMYEDYFSTINKIFGKGFYQFQKLMSNYLSSKHTIEIDFFDIYYSYGIPILLTIYGFHFIIFIKTLLHNNNSKNHHYAPIIIITSIILSLVSLLAGHILTSGLCSIFIAMFLSLSYYKGDEKT